MGSIIEASKGAASKLFTPLEIANGKITLKHRVVLAPLTRNRGVPLSAESTPEKPNRIWYPDELVAEHYRQRTTDGGLLISEALPPSLEVRARTFSGIGAILMRFCRATECPACQGYSFPNRLLAGRR